MGFEPLGFEPLGFEPLGFELLGFELSLTPFIEIAPPNKVEVGPGARITKFCGKKSASAVITVKNISTGRLKNFGINFSA